MATQFIVKHHVELALTEDYKAMIDEMLEKERSGQAEYISMEIIKGRFKSK